MSNRCDIRERITHLKHLSGDDNRLSNHIALGNHHLLSEEDLASGNFDTQITTGDHDTIGHFQYLVEVFNTLFILDLDDNLDTGAVGTKDLTNILDISSPADEGSENHVYAILDAEFEIILILLRESWKVDVGLGEINTLAGAEGSVVESPDFDIRAID